MPFQNFELVTQQTSTRIALDGVLLGWDDEETQRVNEHLILNRPGAIHQDQGPGPRQFTFRCLLRDAPGKPVSDRRKAISETLSADPFCFMIHPRLGRVPVVYLGLRVTEDMEASVNSITVELHLAETGLRDEREESASGATREATAAGLQAVFLTAGRPTLSALAAQLSARLSAYSGAVESVRSQYDLAQSLAQVRASADALASAAGVSVALWPVSNAARSAYGYALAAYLRSGAALPPIIPRTVPQRMSLARFCQSLYGGGARSMEQEIARINAIANPFAIPAGTVLLAPDPAAVKL